MQNARHLDKWIWATVLFAYLVVQAFALWRLKGSQKRRSKTISRAMITLMLVSEAVDTVFYRNRAVSQGGALLTGVAAIVAIVVLAKMFGESPVVEEESQQDEHKLQSLNLG